MSFPQHAEEPQPGQIGPADDAGTLAEQIADQILAKLADQPDQILDRLADRLADRILSRTGAPAPAEVPTAEQVREDSLDTIRENTSAAAIELRGWVMTHHPQLVSGDPDVWASAIVAAATPDCALPMIRWAMSTDCNSAYWSSRTTPLAPPRPGKRVRHGDCAQLISEYRAGKGVPDVCARIEQVIDGVRTQVARYGIHDFKQDPVRARKAALDLLAGHEWNAAQIVDIVAWGMADRPHWRSNIKTVPTVQTFRKVRGDWITAGQPSGPALSAVDDTEVSTLAEGWVYHWRRSQSFDTMPVTAATRRNITSCLTGGDGADPISSDQLKDFVRWLCTPGNRHAAFLVKGVDFPPLASVRRGLAAMKTERSTAVAATNEVAAGAVSAPIDVHEV